MSRILLFFLITAAVTVTGCASGVTPNFLTWQPDINRPLRDVSERDGPFRATLERRYANRAEAVLLTLAEATYPLHPHSVILQGFERPKVGEHPKWWLSTVDGIRVPVTVTQGSVEYLLKLVRAFREGDFSGCDGIPQKMASLEYIAEIEPAITAMESFGDKAEMEGLFIVRMELIWSSDCGQRCGLHFTRTRTAVVHRSGRVVEVLEDPLPSVLVD